ncbi:MAG TPA: DUF167 domain-containing protein [Candidatus Polarisedimenticolia bacterium]|nr:DUF167 domain-containing protein [Candidatus Polarisedimenticolia bacterium]
METAGLDLIETEGGCRILLRVNPAGHRDRIAGPYGSRLRVTVAAAPERGRANDSVIRLLASALGLPPSRLWLVSGARSQDKVVQVDGCSAADLRRRLEALAD